MTLPSQFHEAVQAAAKCVTEPRYLPWPMPGNPGAIVHFETYVQWRDFFLRFDLHPGVPDIITGKFARALKLHLFAWIDFDLLKAGELVAMTALELALTDSYLPRATAHRKALAVAAGNKLPRGNATLADMLGYMVALDGLTDANIPLIQRTGGSVVGRITGKHQPALNNIRNDLAHGYPFDGLPQAGLLELVRDLIEYAYRERIVEYEKSHGILLEDRRR
jgi:hypothetical protein